MKRIALILILAWLPAITFADPTTVPCEDTATELCVDGPATRMINGVSVYKDCWRSQLTYRCAANDVSNQCQPLRDQGCQQVTSTCQESDSYGCIIYDQTYKCPKAATYTEYCEEKSKGVAATCNKVLNISCQSSDGCDAGSIVPGSIAGDMQVSWSPDGSGNYYLVFGSIGDNYWSSGQYDRTLTFEIKDINSVTSFALKDAWWDDHLYVSVNGQMVWMGPYIGDRLELVDDSARYSESGYAPVEGGTSRYQDINIDLKPYLKTGQNSIFTRTVVGGGGEAAIRLITRQVCNNCTETWVDNCQGLAARVPKK